MKPLRRATEAILVQLKQIRIRLAAGPALPPRAWQRVHSRLLDARRRLRNVVADLSAAENVLEQPGEPTVLAERSAGQ